MKTENKKVVIVGTGMAGLTAAAYLARNHYEVVLLEKNDRTGGLLGTFEKNGFRFDTGPRALVNSGIIKPMLHDLGIQCEYLGNRISIGIEDQLLQIKELDDIYKFQDLLISLYPESKDEIKSIIQKMYQLAEYTRVLYEFDNPSFSNRMQDKDYIFKELLPWLVKFLRANQKLNKFNMPMETFMKRMTGNQALIDIITQHFFRKTPTYFALGYFYVYMDYFYPKGGTGSINTLLNEKNLELGVKVQLNTNITEVVPVESLLIDSRGGKYPYDKLVWTADLKTLYRSINAVGLDPETAREIEADAQRVLSSKGAESIFMIYLAVNRPLSFFREKGGEHLFFTPSRQGLGETHLKEKERLLENFSLRSRDEVLAWLDKYINLNTYEISVPALRDETLAPEGQTGVMISCLFDYEVFKKVEESGWYEEFKDIVESRICELICRTLYQGMTRDVLFKFSASPITVSKQSGSSEGAVTGWSFEKEPPVINRLKDIPKSVLTRIPNVYQAGQWAYAPAGVPIAMLTGWYASQAILKLSKKK